MAKPKPATLAKRQEAERQAIIRRINGRKLKKNSRAQYKENWTKEPYAIFPPHMSISCSMIRTFLTCREQCRIGYIEKWRNKASSRPQEIGLAFHGILERYHTMKTPHLTRAVNSYVRSRTRKLNPMEAGIARDIKQSIAVARLMVERYLVFWTKEEAKMVWVAKEELFHIQEEVYVPEMDKTFLVPLKGLIDGLVGHRSHKGRPHIFLHEYKTMSRIEPATLHDTLPVDLQVMMYAYAVSVLYQQCPRGIWYDVTRTPGLRQGVKEDHKQFLDRIREDMVKRPEHYFMRWSLVFLPTDVYAWVKKNLHPILRDMIRWYLGFYREFDPRTAVKKPEDNPYHYTNTEALSGKYGRCDAFDAILRNDYSRLSQQKGSK